MSKKIPVLLIALMMLVTVPFYAGCSKKAEETAASGNQAAPKDELILALGSEPEDGFDPTTGWGQYGSPLFQSTLLKRDADLNIVNDLATTHEVSPDGKIYTVKLRQDVKFSDGQPLTAADVVFTFDTAAKSGSVVDLNNLQKTEAIDDYTVKFTLKTPQSTFAGVLACLGIVPKHAYGENYAQQPMGSGPFKFIQWDKGQQLIVEANPLYYGEKPFFKKITFLYLSEEAAFAAAQAGKVDVAAVVPAVGKQSVPGMRLEVIKSVDNRGICFPYVKAGGKSKDGYPVGNDVTSDIAIRKAVNAAISRQALVEGVLNGFGSPAYTASDHLPWWNPETVIQDEDMEGAKKILADGGWKDADGDGILEKGKLKAEFTLIYPSSDQTRQSLAISAADMIKPLGIQVNAEGKSWDEIEKLMYSNAVLFGWGAHTPLEVFNLYYSGQGGVDYFNPGYYKNPVVDDYLQKALSAPSEAAANEFWKKAQWDGKTGLSAKGDAPWAWLVNLNHLYLVKDNLEIGKQKIQPHGHGWPITDNIAEWHWKQ